MHDRQFFHDRRRRQARRDRREDEIERAGCSAVLSNIMEQLKIAPFRLPVSTCARHVEKLLSLMGRHACGRGDRYDDYPTRSLTWIRHLRDQDFVKFLDWAAALALPCAQRMWISGF